MTENSYIEIIKFSLRFSIVITNDIFYFKFEICIIIPFLAQRFKLLN